GVVGIFVAELTKLRWAAFIGVAVVVIGAIGWNRPQPVDVSEEEELAFEAEHGLPVRVGGSHTLARWGMGLLILFMTIAFASLLLSYFYLRLDNAAWPPAGFTEAPLLPAVGAAVLVVLGGLASVSALRAVNTGNRLQATVR